MKERGDISLADLLTVLDDLRPDPEAAEAMFRILRLEHLKKVALKAVDGSYGSSQKPGKSAGSTKTVGPGLPPAFDEAEVLLEGDPLPLDIRAIGSTSPAEDPPWRGRDDVVALAAAPSRAAKPKTPLPLFDPLRQRAILSAGLATRVPEGELDLEAIVARLVRLEPLEHLQRLPVPTLRHGAQLLLDYSPSMAPFTADRRELRRAIGQLLGSSCATLFFKGCPTRGTLPVVRDRSRTEFEPWQPPARGRVIAILSDLGIGGTPAALERGRLSEWREFGRRAATHGCPVVVFVPFAPSRWDRSLAAAMSLIHWDRHTTVRSVRRAVGIGHGGRA